MASRVSLVQSVSMKSSLNLIHCNMKENSMTNEKIIVDSVLSIQNTTMVGNDGSRISQSIPSTTTVPKSFCRRRGFASRASPPSPPCSGPSPPSSCTSSISSSSPPPTWIPSSYCSSSYILLQKLDR